MKEYEIDSCIVYIKSHTNNYATKHTCMRQLTIAITIKVIEISMILFSLLQKGMN